MVAICLVCREKHEIGQEIAQAGFGRWVMKEHVVAGQSGYCRGTGYEPEKHSICAERSEILPAWVSSVISQIAYDNGHSAGAPEIASIEEGMIALFEEAYGRKE